MCVPIDPCQQAPFGECPLDTTQCVYEGPGQVGISNWQHLPSHVIPFEYSLLYTTRLLGGTVWYASYV